MIKTFTGRKDAEYDAKNERTLIARIKNGGDKEIVALYNEYKIHFVKWATYKYNISADDACDIFQDSIIAFYKNIKQEKISELKYSVKTYLYGIGKNILFNKLKYKSKFDDTFDGFEAIPCTNLYNEWEINADAKHYIKEVLKKLGEPCYTLLRLYYYSEYSMEAIAREIKSKSANVVKSQKVRCLNALRKLVEDKFSLEDLY